MRKTQRNHVQGYFIEQDALDKKAFDGERRAYQKAENKRIGEGDLKVPCPEILDVHTAVSRFVFLSDGSRVADIFNPHYDLAYKDWSATYAASSIGIYEEPILLFSGQNSNSLSKMYLLPLWLNQGSVLHRLTNIYFNLIYKYIIFFYIKSFV
jgi:hypothetical protein